MHLKAINTIIHDGQTYKPGTVFEIEGTDAEVLIAGGFAVQSDEVPAQPAKPLTKAEKAAAAKAADEADSAAQPPAAATADGSEGNAD